MRPRAGAHRRPRAGRRGGALRASQTRTLAGARGVLEPELLRARASATPPTSTTPARAWSASRTRSASWAALAASRRTAGARWPAWAHEHGLRVHMDGARLWNAAVALGRAAGRAGARTPTRVASASPRAWARRSARPWSATPSFDRAWPAATASCFGGRHAPGRRSSPPARCTRSTPRRPAGRRSPQRARAGRRGWPADGGCGSTRTRSRRTSCWRAVPTATSRAELVAELAAAGVLCASLDSETVRFVTHLDVDDDAVEAARGARRPRAKLRSR